MKSGKRVISLIMAAILCAGLMSGCFGGSDTADNTLIFYTNGAAGTATDDVIERVNEILLEKTGYVVDFQFLSADAYDLAISSGDECDLISTPDWLNYWANAAKGAFAEITDEDLQKNAPYIWENGGMSLDVTKYKGTRYAVAGMFESAADRCFVARGDLMDKYGISDLNSIENIEAYLTQVAENEPDLIPFDVPGTTPWLNLALFASDWGWCPIGSLSYGEQVYFRLDDPEHKVFIAAEQPEMLEFTKVMKRWNDKGFFSKSVLSNKTNSLESFKAGRTALAFVDNPLACQSLWDEISQDDRAAWDIRFYTRYHKSQQMNNVTSSMVSISANSKKKDAALKVINEMYANEELYRLIYYGGIEGEAYEIDENGNYVQIVSDDDRGWLGVAINNDEWNLQPALTFPGHEEVVQELYDTRDVNPAVNMPIDDTNIRELDVALTEVFNQYTTPRYYGIMEGTPEEAIAREMEALKAAGIEEYRDDLQRQLDEYLASMEG